MPQSSGSQAERTPSSLSEDRKVKKWAQAFWERQRMRGFGRRLLGDIVEPQDLYVPGVWAGNREGEKDGDTLKLCYTCLSSAVGGLFGTRQATPVYPDRPWSFRTGYTGYPAEPFIREGLLPDSWAGSLAHLSTSPLPWQHSLLLLCEVGPCGHTAFGHL